MRKLDVERFAFLGSQFDAHNRTGGLNPYNARRNGFGVEAMALDLEFVRTNEGSSMEKIDVAEESEHELGSGPVEDLIGRAHLFDSP
jgi:hypothetical protein